MDTIMVDLAKLHYDINCEEFKATLSKYELFKDPEVEPLVSKIVDIIAKLAPNFQQDA